MKKVFAICIFCFCFSQILSSNSIAQVTPKKELKIPTKIDEAFVLEFNSPFNQINIDTDEKAFLNQEVTKILIGTQTKITDAKGKIIDPSQIKTGMSIEIKLEPTLDVDTLIAKSIKLSSIDANKSVEVKGFLDKVSDEEAFVSGKPVIVLPNVLIKGKDEWKTRGFSKFQEIPLGSIVELKGTKREDGRTYITSAEVKPNVLTPVDLKLIEITRTGLTIPPPGQEGAGIRIGQRIFKLSQNLELNQYVTKVGYKVVPRYIKNLADGDPNKILFRFYVLEDDSVNAMALSDGSVFVHTGLLKLIENEAQLAFILAHEIGHVTNEHTRKSLEAAQNRALWMGIAGAAASVAVGQQMGGLIAQAGFGLLSNKYSRNLENEADRIGMFYAYDAGYDVRESEKVWRRMMGDRYNANKVGTFLYSDHPSLLSRLKNTKHEFIINYPSAKFDESIIGREKYMDVVGVYFGWVQPKPKMMDAPKNANTQFQPSTINSNSNASMANKTASVGTHPKIKNPTNSAVITTSKPSGKTNIRTIDFKNFTYPIFEDKTRKFAKLVKGKLILSRDKTDGPNGYQVVKILYGDLNNDGVEDAVISFLEGNLEPAKFDQQGIIRTLFYTLENGKPKLLYQFTDRTIEPLYKLHFAEDAFLITGGVEKIVNGVLHYEVISAEGMCCPKWNVTMLLRWNGNKFSLLQAPSRKPWGN